MTLRFYLGTAALAAAFVVTSHSDAQQPSPPTPPSAPDQPVEQPAPGATASADGPAPDGTAALPTPADTSAGDPASDTPATAADAVEAEAGGAGPDSAEAGAELSPDAPAPTQPPIASDDERPLPDYDGRGDDPVTAEEVFIWIPRGLFFPVYLVAEYGVRWPIGKLTSALDEADLPAIFGDFFTFGPGDKMGLVPSALIDFGFRPSIGAYFFSDDLPVDGLGFRSHVAFGGVDWYRATGTVRYTLDEATPGSHEKFVQVKGIYSHRPDWLFWGIGPESRKSDESGYTAQYIDAFARYEGGYWRSGQLKSWVGIRHAEFFHRHSDSGPGGTPGIVSSVAQGRYTAPPLFPDGYFVFKSGVDLSVDTRRKRTKILEDGSDFLAPPGHGVKLAPRMELATGLREETSLVDPADTVRPSWVKYGGTLGGFVDLYNQRVIGLQAIVDFIDPLDDAAPIPFNELVSLGGSRPMRGFLESRLLGRSSAVMQLDYTWPIWVSLDGALHYSVGNVFGEHLDGFDATLLRQSFGLGFGATAMRDHNFEFLLAFGTETFDQGSNIDTVRFVIGASEGF